jgi:hypothetical protein
MVKEPLNYNFIVNGRSLNFGYDGTAGHNFTVDNDGNVKIKGEIKADSGYIGGWSLGEKDPETAAARTVLYSGANLANARIILDPSDGIYGSQIKVGNDIKAPNLYINNKGQLGIGRKYKYNATTEKYEYKDADGKNVTSPNIPLNELGYKFFVDSNGALIISDVYDIYVYADATTADIFSGDGIIKKADYNALFNERPKNIYTYDFSKAPNYYVLETTSNYKSTTVYYKKIKATDAQYREWVEKEVAKHAEAAQKAASDAQGAADDA